MKLCAAQLPMKISGAKKIIFMHENVPFIHEHFIFSYKKPFVRVSFKASSDRIDYFLTAHSTVFVFDILTTFLGTSLKRSNEA